MERDAFVRLRQSTGAHVVVTFVVQPFGADRSRITRATMWYLENQSSHPFPVATQYCSAFVDITMMMMLMIAVVVSNVRWVFVRLAHIVPRNVVHETISETITGASMVDDESRRRRVVSDSAVVNMRSNRM